MAGRRRGEGEEGAGIVSQDCSRLVWSTAPGSYDYILLPYDLEDDRGQLATLLPRPTLLSFSHYDHDLHSHTRNRTQSSLASHDLHSTHTQALWILERCPVGVERSRPVSPPTSAMS